MYTQILKCYIVTSLYKYIHVYLILPYGHSGTLNYTDKNVLILFDTPGSHGQGIPETRIPYWQKPRTYRNVDYAKARTGSQQASVLAALDVAHAHGGISLMAAERTHNISYAYVAVNTRTRRRNRINPITRSCRSARVWRRIQIANATSAPTRCARYGARQICVCLSALCAGRRSANLAAFAGNSIS